MHSLVGARCTPVVTIFYTARGARWSRSTTALPKFFKTSSKPYDIHTHKVTDHKHYWEDGGATYHQRFKSFEFVRGQEGDKWKGRVITKEEKEAKDPATGELKINKMFSDDGYWAPDPAQDNKRMDMAIQDAVNRVE